ncbi:probable disease resistance protein At4g27220 [Eucalyptus grandis]|uniref:probable disease resistance protein At4g27220 n=1 Tax=Eucalyptus grandis TaxID=71139 RepID=UPI00192EA657|nr:probable disease resistance protein At4g27220 [Eucalyptus grandis]
MAEAIAYPVASNLLSKLGECLFAPIGRQFGYVLCYKCYVEDLKNGVKELEIAWERVQHDVQDAKNNGKPIYTDVENWLKCESANNACFCGWLPNPVVRHPIGRKVKKITKVILGLQEKSPNNKFQKVYYESSPIGIASATTYNKEDLPESRAKIMEDVMRAIVDDKVCAIGVWGAGGVGKSKLLEDVERQIKEQKLYDVVAKANISRSPDLKRIQGEIAHALGLKLMNEKTTYGRANCLRKRLESDNEKNILIILDNLWEKLELKEVGIPCGDDNKVRGCKLLLTSRYRDVLRIDMCSNQQFQLNELEDGEAQRLFERIVGDKVKNPEFTSLVRRVVKNCGGLPLLIVSLAKRLKHEDLAAWRNASTYIDVSNVKSLVETNYNDLKDERIRSLFLICALESGRISLRDNFIYCMGLGLFKKFSNTLENARDRLIMDLHSLQDSSLLLDSNDTEKFRMHDIFVDATISILSTEWNALVGRKDFGFKEWSTHELRECTAISFLLVGIDELPKNLDCPNLRMLLLAEHNQSLKIPESFFESMEKLQVLDITGLSFTSLPPSIELLGNLKSLCLDDCHLEDVTVLGKLKRLQFLSFFKSAIPRLPKEIGELTELRFLDLTVHWLKVIEPGVLKSLVNLEELYMEDSLISGRLRMKHRQAMPAWLS